MAGRSSFFNGAFLLLALAACSEPERRESAAKPSVQANTSVVEMTTVSNLLEVSGTVRARTTTVLASRVMGQVETVMVQEGDRVRPGQVLSEIESRDAVAQLRRAQAAVIEAQRGLEEAANGVRGAQAGVRAAEVHRDLAMATRNRYETLRDKNSISPQEYDEVDTRYRAAVQQTEQAQEALAGARARQEQLLSRVEQAEAAVESAGAMVEYLRIVSPIEGVVTRRSAEPGMLATPGAPFFVVEDTRAYDLEAAVEESRVSTIRVGQSVRVEIDAVEIAVLEGRVREIAPSSDSASRTTIVKVQLPSAANKSLRSGLFGRAFFAAGSRQAVVIPSSALIRRGQLEGVYVVVEDTALFRLVTTGKAQATGIEVLSGLEPGTRILTAPDAGVVDGVKILSARSPGTNP